MEGDIRARLFDLCEKHKVSHLFLFGSALRDDFNEDRSDLDFIVEFLPTIPVLEFAHNFFAFQFGLEDLFGKSIDLICSNELKNPVLLSEIENSKVELYAA